MVGSLTGAVASQSYGGSVLSSLTTVLSSALVFSTSPPVSVCGTDQYTLTLEAFLGSMGSTTRFRVAPSTRRKSPEMRIGITIDHLAYPSPSLIVRILSAGILTCPPSTTPVGLVLGPD